MNPSDKGWLRAHFPRATAKQIEAFVERVAIKLECAKPTAEAINKARLDAFNEMMGTVA
ncbi:MAG: hypothetical protein ACR65O_05450 [Methylomicrobium sp.]